MPGTRKLGRATDNRTAMLRAMVTFLLENGKIETTVTRAKEVRSMAEKMITIAKEDSLANKRLVLRLSSQKTMSCTSFSPRLPRSMPTVTAVIPALQRSDPAAATQRKWRLSS